MPGKQIAIPFNFFIKTLADETFTVNAIMPWGYNVYAWAGSSKTSSGRI
ncbi:hypothetical protein GCM10027043_15000 [Ferruginibacter profundus]